MLHTAVFQSPIGEMLLAEDVQGLGGAWFVGQAHFPAALHAPAGDTPLLREAAAWLACYFSGDALPPLPPLSLGGTAFQQAVLRMLTEIPYGKSTTYGAIAAALSERMQHPVSARAVGGAVGRNPVSVMIPCHRVLGAGDRLTGYAGGLWRKRFLLTLEQIPFTE